MKFWHEKTCFNYRLKQNSIEPFPKFEKLFQTIDAIVPSIYIDDIVTRQLC